MLKQQNASEDSRPVSLTSEHKQGQLINLNVLRLETFSFKLKKYLYVESHTSFVAADNPIIYLRKSLKMRRSLENIHIGLITVLYRF